MKIFPQFFRIVTFCAATLVLYACNQEKPKNDPYDPAKMDFKSPAARLTTERHTGPFATGSALNMGSELKPLDPSPVKTIRLDTTHKIIEIAPGVKFSAWTFGNQVPGPTIRARVGDTIKFSMTNRSDEAMPGVQLTAAPMMHSMDFHAAMVSPQDKYRSIAPGQTIEFEFTLNYPGIFMFHCGTPMILEHIASGMYGALIVEPRDGYPTKADREYIVIQSEFYVKPDPQSRQIDGQPLYVLDGDNLKKAMPSYTVFNGTHNGMVKNPLPAKPGERVRLYVLNVGPSKTSSFHVVGTIFDRVWMEGNPDNQFRGMQTVLLGSSNSAIVEFIVPENGKYIMVDHHFANASQGAIGLIDASTKKEEKTDIEHHNMEATATPNDPAAMKGKLDFESKCLACHSIGQGRKMGPDLAGVTKRRSDDWLAKWLESPEKMLASDIDAKAMLKEYNSIPMPNQNLNGTEIQQYLQYFHWVELATRWQYPRYGWSLIMRIVLCAIGLVLGLNISMAQACGHCVEDKVAAVYDYTVVTHARMQKHNIAFFAIDGTFVPNESLKRVIETAVRSTDGVDRDSVRVSLELAALSFSFDPKRLSFATAQKSLGEKLSIQKLLLFELKFIDEFATIKTVERR